MHIIDHYKIDCAPAVRHKIGTMMQEHVNAVVQQVVSMAAIIAMLRGKHKIDVSHLSPVRTYVTSKCGTGRHKVKGGSMPSDFYGYPHPAYTSANVNGGVQVSSIDWAKQEARPALGPSQQGPTQSGGGSSSNHTTIQSVLKDLNVSISKSAQDELQKIIDGHVACFIHDVRQATPVTVKKLEKILKLSRHASFKA